MCYNCKQTGHLSRECPEPRNPAAGGETDRVCYRCYQPGHLAKDCPTEQATAGQECYKCGRLGHIARNCPQGAGGMMPRNYNTGYNSYAYGATAKQCYSCGGFGHMSRDCTQGQKCYNCEYLLLRFFAATNFITQVASMAISQRIALLQAPSASATSASSQVTSRLNARTRRGHLALTSVPLEHLDSTPIQTPPLCPSVGSPKERHYCGVGVDATDGRTGYSRFLLSTQHIM